MTSAPKLPVIAMPTGGGEQRGMGATFAPEAFTGTNALSFPIRVTAVRDITPDLKLAYSAGGGNGAFGLGFDIAVPRISVRTETGVPRYDGSDQFVMDGVDVLVPRLVLTTEGWLPDRETRQGADGAEYLVTGYRPRVASSHARVECWQRLSDGDVHWRAISTENATTLFGQSTAARIFDPKTPNHIFAWLCESVQTDTGDQTLYAYVADNADNLANLPSSADRSNTAQKYLSEIRYGAYNVSGTSGFAVRIVFDYGQYDYAPSNPNPYLPVRSWPVRPDPFSSYRTGFEIRTNRLCQAVMVFHALPELGAEPCLIAVTRFGYDSSSGISLLRTLDYIGYDHGDAGNTTTLAVPATTFHYQGFSPESQSFARLDLEDSKPPGTAGSAEFQLVDLYGDGLPGLLTSTPSEFLYWRNEGGGRFAAPHAPSAFPNNRDLTDTDGLALVDLDGNGRFDLLVNAPGGPGYYGNDGEGLWSPFRAFPTSSPEAATPAAQFVDLEGNGRAELVIMAPEALRYYPGLGTDGYGPPINLTTPEPLPNPSAFQQRAVVRFADMFGDGGSHLVRIVNGEVLCWPSLGHGRFAPPVQFDNAPAFPGPFEAERILVGDFTGSGPADIVYVAADRVFLYANACGDGFADPTILPLPHSFGPLSEAITGDVYGNGNQCLIISGPGDPPSALDFTGGITPNLLAGLDNGMGGSTSFTYASSTTFMLADQLAGTPWPDSLPSPVQVLVETSTVNPFCETVLRTRMAYHDGYYDREQRQFRGFGYVQTWTDETQNGQAVTPAVYNRAWYQTGAYQDQDAFYARYLSEFFSGDPEELILPPSQPVLLSSPADPPTLVEAQRALAGQLIRSEVYGQDGVPEQDIPYTVEERNYTMRQMQPREGRADAVFQVESREAISFAYERNAQDPRVTHNFSLLVNDYNEVTLAANIAYPRRPNQGAYPEQLHLGANATTRSFANDIGKGYLPLEPAEDRSFTLGNLSTPTGLYFTFEEIGRQVSTALQNIIPPETPFSGTTPQARVRAWTRHYYWDATRTAALPLNEVTSPALPHHAETAQLSSGMAIATYGGKLTDAEIETEGYYIPADGYWWNPGEILFYADAAQFFLPLSTQAQNGSLSGVVYDPYALLAIEAYNADGTAHSVPDYQSFEPVQITDENGTVTQVLFDALARPIVSTTFRLNADGEREGDGDISSYQPVPGATLQDVIAAPDVYLQQMTSYYFHSFAPAPGQPPVQLTVARQFHVSDLPPDTPSPVRMTLVYFDAGGETLESKQQVEAAAVGAANAMWLTTEKTLKGAQGQTLRIYLPELDASAEFQFYGTGLYDTANYDALQRRIRLLTAKGFVSRDVYKSWASEQWDLDDAVKSSPYYQSHIGDTDPAFADQRDALIKAAVFDNTPVTQIFDPLGRTVRIEQVDLSTLEPTPVMMTTLSVLDAEGRPVKMADPRFSAGGVPTTWNITTAYDLAGNGIAIASVDSGSRTAFYNAMGAVAQQWDARGTHIQRDYDAMVRPLRVLRVPDQGQPLLLEAYTYGTAAIDNTIGRLITLRDQSGLTTYSDFSLEGKPQLEQFSLCQSYMGEVDWTNDVPLEAPLSGTQELDALREIVSETRPDGSTLNYSYYATGWVAAITLTLSGQATQPVVSNTQYNAFGALTQARYGSGIEALRRYEDSTGNLVGILSRRVSDGTALQDITYAYDPVGNVTSAEDRTIPLVFCNQTQVSPRLDYSYDAAYRLLVAKGRENPAISATTYQTGFKQSVYMPLCAQNPNDDVKLIPYQETYSYDLSGNLQSIVHTTTESTLSWTRAMTTAATSDRTVLAGGLPVEDSFDACGNLIDLGGGQPLTWNWANALASATLVVREGEPNDTDYYVYNSSGERRRKVMARLTAGGLKVQDVVYFGGLQFYRDVPTDGSAPTVTRQGLLLGEGEGRILMVYQWPDGSHPTQFRYQLTTALDSVALEVDPAGLVISYEEYFPYGGTAIIAGDSEAEVELKYYRFTGKECDDSTGLYYFGARYYASWLGRWINCDPSGPADALNLYEYVGCNPLSNSDPSGEGKETINFTLDPSTVAAFKNAYQYLSDDVVVTYQTLATDIHEYVYKFNTQARDDPTARLTPKLEQRVLDMFDAHKDLHLGSNPQLAKLWDVSKARVNLGADPIKNYTKIRSPHFTNTLKETPLYDIIDDPKFHRTVELHHGAKKALRPEYADTAQNLWALSRGGQSYGDLGQHDSAFHLVGAAEFGNRYTTEIGAYSGLMLHWEGIQTLSGNAPGLPPPPPQIFTPLPLLAQIQTPIVQVWTPPVVTLSVPTPSSSSARLKRKVVNKGNSNSSSNSSNKKVKQKAVGIQKPAIRRSARLKRK